MPSTLQVKKGQTRRLPPGQSFTGGLGWDEAAGQAEADLDLWILRFKKDGTCFPVYWGNGDAKHPELGTIHDPITNEENPYLATPELELVHTGDDRTGYSSQGGYDENITLNLSQAPADVVQYAFFVTIYDESGTQTLGIATNIKCGVKEEASGNELVCHIEDEHGFDVTVLVCTIDRDPEGHWAMTGKDEGYSDDMITVAKKLGIHGFVDEQPAV
jgi:stress response protein SCP2